MIKKTYNRRSIRLKNYDYSQAGAYFITICTQNRDCLFGNIVDGEMVLNDAGKMVQTIWDGLADYYRCVQLDAWVIMPNHVHGIINIASPRDSASPHDSAHWAEMDSAPTDSTHTDSTHTDSAPTLGTIVQSFKRHSTIEYIKLVKQGVVPSFDKRIWQRNYYENIIRNENDYNRICKYIENNPAKWKSTSFQPKNISLYRHAAQSGVQSV